MNECENDGVPIQSVPRLDLSGRREQGELPRLGDAKDHRHLLAICISLPTDHEPYGYRVRDGFDCSCGCKWYLPLQSLPLDWGVCVNPQSPRCGLLTFEHQGCQFFEGLPEDNDA
jgi:hypothetical protein